MLSRASPSNARVTLTGQKRPRPNGKPQRLCVIDPNDGNNDISRGTSLSDLILHTFREAHRTLDQRMNELSQQSPSQRRGRSILGSIIGGDYTSYERQRERLRRLVESKGGKDEQKK